MKIALRLSVALSIIFTAMPWSSAISQGDAEAGKVKSAACVACHGADGNTPLDPSYPKIGGQIPGYVADTLAAYKSGQRSDPVMQGMVLNLSEQDMSDIDAYYAEFEFTPASIAESDAIAAERGRSLYRIGQSQYSVPACMACHGPAGKGIPRRFPRVAGQQLDYLIKSLNDYKTGSRTSEEMNPISFRLTASQIKDLAIYMHGLN